MYNMKHLLKLLLFAEEGKVRFWWKTVMRLTTRYIVIFTKLIIHDESR